MQWVWATWLIIALLVVYVLSEAFPKRTLEGFLVREPTEPAGSWDAHYTAQHVDIQGSGYALDFCRAVRAIDSDPGSLRILCDVPTEHGVLQRETRTVAEGLRLSRDDYWNTLPGSKQMRYCRILRDDATGEWAPSCTAVGTAASHEETDTNPPPPIRTLLDAYEGILTWFRFRDDGEDYAKNTVYTTYGSAELPTLVGATVSRGLQLNRWPAAAQEAGQAAPPLRDYLRFGEQGGALTLDQAIPPRQIRAIAFWIWWDALEAGASVVECSNGDFKDRFWLGVEGGGAALPPGRVAEPAAELRPAAIQAIGQLTEPLRIWGEVPAAGAALTRSAGRYVFEIWDETQRLMRLEAPQSSARTGQWQHVVVSTTDATTWWPTWQMWINGEVVAERADGRLSPALELAQNYIGRNARGCIQDFRMYRTPMTRERILAAMRSSRPALHPVP